MFSRDRILAHRGLWSKPSDQNTIQALVAAIGQGFGIETDIRDRLGELVVSHDPPDAAAPTLSALLEALPPAAQDVPMAFNIKSDGLGQKFLSLNLHKLHLGLFFFDMSIPETAKYAASELPIAIRYSEFEDLNTDLTQESKTVWLDSFTGDWMLDLNLASREYAGLRFIIVSPELHGRSHLDVWHWVRNQRLSGADVLLCTDFPDACYEFLNAKNDY